MLLPFKNTRAIVTREHLDVADAMSGRQVSLQIMLVSKLAATNVTLVFGVRIISPDVLWSMYGVVVSVDL